MRNYSKIDEIIRALDEKNLILEKVNIKNDISIKGIAIDSRKVQSGYIFICIKGFTSDGHKFAKASIEKGASLLVCEFKQEIDCPQIIVKDSRKAEAVIAQKFYETENHKYKLIGITGTNGKTTIAHLISEILSREGYKCGVIGTLGYQIGNKHFPLERTTPDSLKLHKILKEMQNLDFVIMEVSSHSLILDRVFGIEFDGANFTNLTQDHLDFHKDMDSYAQAKFKLFKQLKTDGIAIIYVDDKYGESFYNKLKVNKKSVSFKKGDYQIINVSISPKNTEFDLVYKDRKNHFISNLIGKYNVINLALSVAMVNEIAGISLSSIAPLVKKPISVSGRLQAVENNRNIHIFIDYAHTPDALKNVLASLNELKKGRIITVFGAGGNRDKKKRPLMYKEVIEKSDLVIVTSDNPRDENPIDIIKDILSQEYDKNKTLIYSDRKTAIQVAIRMAKPDDIVLIAGKGHETYQEIKGEKHFFSDRKEVESALQKGFEGNLFIPISLFWIYKVIDKTVPNDFSDEIFFNLTTDSRKIDDNSLFIALKGEKFDGHNFVKDVIKNNGVFAIVNNDYQSESDKVIKVDDTLVSYGKLAKYYKAVFDVETIAITGSVGKTTTKEYLYKILSSEYSVHKSKGNENNQIGVPKSIFSFKNQDFLIIELGTNHFGEIEYLTDIVQPNVGIITNIGNSHLEFFGSKEGVFNEKINIFNTNPKIKIVNGDDEFLKKYDAIKVGKNLGNDYRITDVESDFTNTKFKLNNENYEIKTPYSVFVINASLAIAAAKKLGMAYRKIKDALLQELDISMRMEIVKKENIIFLNDCYNANPDSMKAAIKFWSGYLPERKHFAILGDMLELGDKASDFHKEIGDLLRKTDYVEIVSIGNFSKNYKAEKHFENVDKFLISNYIHKLPKESVVLIKASHGIGLDKIVRSL